MLRTIVVAVALAVALSGCSWRWVADHHASHGHAQGAHGHTVEDYRREARAYTRAWARAIRNHQQSQDLVWRWSGVAACESGGDWSINTGNGFYGGLQFTLSSWRAVGGTGYPHHHPPVEQARRAERLKAIQGLGAWPNCGRYYRG